MEEIKDPTRKLEDCLKETAILLYERLSNPRVNFTITIGHKNFDIGNGYWAEEQDQRQTRIDLIRTALNIDVEALINRALWEADEKMRRQEEITDEIFEDMMHFRMQSDRPRITDTLMDLSTVRVEWIEMVVGKEYEVHSSELVNPLNPESPIIKAQRMSDDELSHEWNKHAGGGE